MKWAQITYLCIILLVLMASGCVHGKPRTGKNNFPATMAFLALEVWIIYCAGGLSKVFP